MIAADTSSFSNFMKGVNTTDALLVEKAIMDETLVLPPMVVAELLSFPNLTDEYREVITAFPRASFKEGYWERVGNARATILREGKKARLADTMIAVFCLDHSMPIISSDVDYRHFVEFFELELKPDPDLRKS